MRGPGSVLETAGYKLRGHWDRYVRTWFDASDAASSAPIAVLMPLAPKDIARARRSVPMIRRHLAHPIRRFVIVAPDRPEIRRLCAELEADFVDETGPLAELVGPARAAALTGWYRQQLLKLVAPLVAGADDVVAIDSDTYPIRPTAFLTPDGRTILYRGDRNLAPYHRFTEALIGRAPGRRTSFVAHCMLFRRRHLKALYAAIEAHTGAPWTDAILAQIARPLAEIGVLSEFDLYGHYLLREQPEALRMRYFANLKVAPATFAGETALPWWNRRFRFVSNHQRGGEAA